MSFQGLTDRERIEVLERELAVQKQALRQLMLMPIGRSEIAMRVLATFAAFGFACWASRAGVWWASFLGLLLFGGWGINAARAWVLRQSGTLVKVP